MPAPSRPLPTGLLLAAALLTLPAVARASEPPAVIASFKPVHSLAAAVMQGVGTPALLVEGAASPHTYSMRPSDAAKLDAADVVFWIGPALEAFLVRPVATLAADASVLEIEEIPGLTLYPPREGGVWAPHSDAHEGEEHADEEHEHDEEEHAEEEHAGEDHEHEAGTVDAHLWLDPGNAKTIAAAMAESLAAADPANAAAYRANAADLAARIDALDAELAAELAPVRDRPFIVFHDAYQYFEAHYGLAAAGSITVSPDQPPGAKRLSEIRATIAERGAACVFREPQFEPALIDLVIEGSGARQGELDPEAAALAEGPELYFEMMRGLARSIAGCLGESS
jgi:zinc transport system substrate-binding protein